MKKTFLLLLFLYSTFYGNAQNVGIGTDAPLAKLHISNGPSGATPFAFSPLVVENSGHTYINLLSPAANETAILFGQPGNAANGVLMYNNISTPNGFQFRNNGNLTRMVIDNSGSVGIGVTTPDANAILDLSSTTKGLLLPRMKAKERDAINGGNATAGLMVYCTDCTPAGSFIYNGSAWTPTSSSASGSTYTIGQAAQGGIVFWVDDSGQHGLAAGTDDLFGGAALQWWFNGPMVWCNRVRRDGIYTGQLNTDSIITRHNSDGAFAAGLCAKYLGGGYGDWYLPSLTELSLLFDQRVAVGGFASAWYWSSTEGNFDNAQTHFFGSNSIGASTKTDVNRIRAVRRF
jgi:hypothetical protein